MCTCPSFRGEVLTRLRCRVVGISISFFLFRYGVNANKDHKHDVYMSVASRKASNLATASSYCISSLWCFCCMIVERNNAT